MATLHLAAARPRALHCRCSAAEPAAAAPGIVARRAVLSAATLLALRPSLPVSAAAGPASPALLHAVLRVKALDAAASFAVDALGMKVLRSRPGNVFVGFGTEAGGQNFSLELEPTDDGTDAAPGDFGGIVLAVDNPSKAAAKAAAAGARRASGGLRCSGDAIAGCAIGGVDELPLRVAFVKGAGPSLARVVLGVASLPRAVAFYRDALGMTQLTSQAGVSDRAAEDPAPDARALLAFGKGKVALELRESKGAPASAALFDKIAISVPDLAAAASRVEAAGVGALLKQPFAVPGVGTRVAVASDPDGHVIALVDAADFEKELL